MSYTARTVGFKPGERNVFFHILTACNLSCSHCYINPLQHGSNTLPIETIEKWLEHFTDDHKELYKVKYYQALIDLGYEIDLEW